MAKEDSDEPTEIVIPEPRRMPTQEEIALRRKKLIRFRIWFYSLFFGLIYGFIWIQPYEFDFYPRAPYGANPIIDPDSKKLFAKGTKVLIVTAHPDDSEFFAGATLAKLDRSGAELHQVICTDGDKGYYLFFTNAAENRVVRRQEATNAAAAWHAKSLEFLGYPDRFLHANEDVIARISDSIERIKPDYILTFDGNLPVRASHQDHRRCGDATLIAAERTHIAKWIMMFQTIAPNFVVDITDLWEDEKRLLQIHKSQFSGEHLNGVENMISSSAEKDGALIGVDLGEGFRCVKLR
jgi:LmbE family N-acetylglucosaminyl deacetylase